MMKKINYSKFQTNYVVIDIIVGILVALIFLFSIIRDQKIFFSKRSVKDIKKNWENTPVIDIIKVPQNEDCPLNYEMLYNETFQGTNKGCFCESKQANETIIYSGACVDSRDNDKCKNVEEIKIQKLKLWRNSNLCFKRMSNFNNTNFYLKYFNILNKSNVKTCPQDTKQCGILDNLGNPFCIENTLECPINDIIITKDLSLILTLNYTTIQLSNGYSLYFTNQATNSTIINNVKISDGNVCLDPTEHNYTSNLYPLFKEQEPFNCENSINDTINDNRYVKYDQYNMLDFYSENNLSEKLKTLPEWEKKYFNNQSKIELYIRPYIGWNVNCLVEQNKPEIVIWMTQYINDITDLQNELFYFHVIVILSYLLINVVVKWRLINERIDFVYLVLLEAIFVILCLIEVAISFVGISKFNNFSSANINVIKYDCNDDTTKLIFAYLGDVFYNYSLHFYVICFFAVISCFLYPLNSGYIYYSRAAKVEAKELQTLVPK